MGTSSEGAASAHATGSVSHRRACTCITAWHSLRRVQRRTGTEPVHPFNASPPISSVLACQSIQNHTRAARGSVCSTAPPHRRRNPTLDLPRCRGKRPSMQSSYPPVETKKHGIIIQHYHPPTQPSARSGSLERVHDRRPHPGPRRQKPSGAPRPCTRPVQRAPPRHMHATNSHLLFKHQMPNNSFPGMAPQIPPQVPNAGGPYRAPESTPRRTARPRNAPRDFACGPPKPAAAPLAGTPLPSK